MIALATKLIIKNKNADPTAGDLAVGELGYNSNTKQLFVGNGAQEPSGVLMEGAALPVSPTPFFYKTLNFTLGITDCETFIGVNSASPITVTVPTDASASIPVGSEIYILRCSSGDVVFSPQSGVELRSEEGKKKINAQYQVVFLKKIAVNTWILIGALKT